MRQDHRICLLYLLAPGLSAAPRFQLRTTCLLKYVTVFNAANTLSTAATPNVRSSESDVVERVLFRVNFPFPLKYLSSACSASTWRVLHGTCKIGQPKSARCAVCSSIDIPAPVNGATPMPLYAAANNENLGRWESSRWHIGTVRGWMAGIRFAQVQRRRAGIALYYKMT